MFHCMLLASALSSGAGNPKDFDLQVARLTYNHLRLPSHGILHKGKLYGFLDDSWIKAKTKDGHRDWGVVWISAIPVDNPVLRNWTKCRFIEAAQGFNWRMHLQDRGLWYSATPFGMTKLPFDDLHKYTEDPQQRKEHPFPMFTTRLSRQYERNSNHTRDSLPSPEVLGYGVVPTFGDNCKCYMLLKTTKKFEVWDNRQEEQTLETFDSIFAESFYFFLRKDDYYFATESGKLYYAPARQADEKSRVMKPLWDNPKRPIVAILEDADPGAVWLFAKDNDPDAKFHHCIEMDKTLTSRTFDPDKLKPAPVEGRAGILLRYLPLIREDRSKQEKRKE